jgi:arsenite methyltransferase
MGYHTLIQPNPLWPDPLCRRPRSRSFQIKLWVYHTSGAKIQTTQSFVREQKDSKEMSKTQPDIWSKWLLQHRHGGDSQQLKAVQEYLVPMRDKVLHNATLKENDVLLDVGCGDGLIAFGALEQHKTIKVIFSDISQDLLTQAQSLAEEMDLLLRCQFMKASADDLSALDNESVDVVTTRSVLIYVAEKQAAFREFYRVLRPGGRLSIFEPINRFAEAYPTPEHFFLGYDVTPVKDLALKVNQVYRRYQLPNDDPMLDFDEYDLIAFAEQVGFGEIHLELQVNIKPSAEKRDVETILRTAPNPKLPTTEEAIHEALTPAEADRLISYFRSIIEEKQALRTIRYAGAYFWALKG